MRRILVIDDDAALRALTVKALQARGFQTLTAEDGLAGLETAKRSLPDLIICDIQMPKLNGFETLAALQQDGLTATIPFIFLTGLSDHKQVRYAMGMGADDYLTKPFTIGELMAAVNARLAKHAAVQRLSDKKLEDLRGNIGRALPHELLTPLNGILGLASVLVDDQAVFPAEEVRTFGRDIQISALRLYRLIENFIIYSEIELISSEPQKAMALRQGEAIPIKDAIVRATQEKAEAAVREKDLELQVAEGNVALAPRHLKKAIEEVVENAFKFSKPNTPVLVIGVVQGRSYLLSVVDRGRGMTAEQVANVGAHMQFERRFYEQQGAGLGLIIAKRLTELYGGDVTIESTPGLGTSVQLALPLAGAAATEAGASPPEPDALPGMLV
jgi:CheY-like chemotaxis protein/anti-sigma regulatory factor (Ser/Thr protein kinase)